MYGLVVLLWSVSVAFIVLVRLGTGHRMATAIIYRFHACVLMLLLLNAIQMQPTNAPLRPMVYVTPTQIPIQCNAKCKTNIMNYYEKPGNMARSVFRHCGRSRS